MHKAYDRVEWGLLEKMIKLGFAARWVRLIMSCVSSVRYSVRFNSMDTDIIIPTRGILQGDPLFVPVLCQPVHRIMTGFKKK
jgi:hypothetical protein